MLNNHPYLQRKQNCQRNFPYPPHQQQQQQYTYSLSHKCRHIYYYGHPKKLVTTFAIVFLVNIIVANKHNVITSETINFEIGRGSYLKIEDKQNIGVDINGMSSQSVDSESGKQQQKQHNRNGFHAKFSALDKEVVDRLIKEWAPIVWLAPGEKFMPLGVDEFLNHVHPMEKGKTLIPGIPIGENSTRAYLVTKAEIDELLENEKSFLYGRNPMESPVPIYAVIKLCYEPSEETFFSTSETSVRDDPVPQMPEAYNQLKIRAHSDFHSGSSSNTNSVTTTFQNSPLSHAAASILLSSTRGPYIPISIDPLDVHNDTGRRSSRLYPLFNHVKQNSLHSIGLGEYNPPSLVPFPPISAPLELMVQTYTDGTVELTATTDAPTILTVENSGGQVNNFIDNLADNVKFSMPTEELMDDNNVNNDKNFARLPLQGNIWKDGNSKNTTGNKPKKIPNFHVTYWMFYPYSQGKTMCTVSLGPLGSIPFPAVYGFCLGTRKDIGSHIGDWEHMSLYFNGDVEPEAMYVSAHDFGAYYSYNRLTGTFEFKKQETRKGILQRPNFPKTVTTFNNHPVLFAAKGSHGLWTAPGKHRFVKVARLYDINGFGTPWNTWKSVDITYENLKSYARSLVPSWLSFKGKWGNPKSKCHPFRRIGLNFCEYTDGPTGIPLKEPHFQCRAE